MIPIILDQNTQALLRKERKSLSHTEDLSCLLGLLLHEETLSDELRLFLLRDIQKTLAPVKKKGAAPHKQTSISKLGLAGVIIAGVLYAICDGFSGMSTIVQAFISSSMLVFGLSMGFALLSIALFFLMQIQAIADYFGFSLQNPSKEVACWLEERQVLGALFETLKFKPKQMTSTYSELKAYMYKRLNTLQKKADILKEKQHRLPLDILFAIIVCLVGLWVWTSGFFLGYSVVITVLALFELTTPFWLPFAVAPFIGFAACCLFWITQARDLRRIVDRLFGVDEAWIEALSEEIFEQTSSSSSRMLLQTLDDGVVRQEVACQTEHGVNLFGAANADSSFEVMLLPRNSVS